MKLKAALVPFTELREDWGRDIRRGECEGQQR